MTAAPAVDLQATDRCKSCSAPIAFALTSKRRRMPVDPAPVLGGNVEISAAAGVLYARVMPAASPDDLGYVSHFSSCPNAREHRRR